MSIASASFRAPGGFAGAFKTFADEVALLAGALLNPGKIIGEVEQMRALQLEAKRVEVTDPARAEELRRRASRLGL
jgi:hypothetical protein